MVHLSANIESAPSFQPSTDIFLGNHGFNICGNDYTATNLNAVRNLFQPQGSRPVFLIINCVSNSSSHRQWQLLLNHNGTGINDFSANIIAWRNLMDSVQAPPPRLTGARRSGEAFEFTIPGQRGRTNRVEATTDFVQWTTLTNVFGTNAPVVIRDGSVGADPQRFYRVVRP